MIKNKILRCNISPKINKTKNDAYVVSMKHKLYKMNKHLQFLTHCYLAIYIFCSDICLKFKNNKDENKQNEIWKEID